MDEKKRKQNLLIITNCLLRVFPTKTKDIKKKKKKEEKNTSSIIITDSSRSYFFHHNFTFAFDQILRQSFYIR